jgi:hypothetical protein
MLDYHHLAMDEPRDSPQKTYQFRAVSAIMIVLFFYMTIPAGLFHSVKITEGNFPGGTFVYKSAKRDYVASLGLETSIGEDLGMPREDFEDKVYTIFLDDTWKVNSGRAHRFASGFLSRNNKSDRVLQESLLAMNPSIQPPSRLEVKELPADELWPRLRYKKQSLPAAKSAIVIFPSTNGFVSSLMFTFRILPALRNYAAEKQLARGKKFASVTIMTTCSLKNQMCTHYSPIESSEAFLLGQPRTEEYVKSLPVSKALDLKRNYKFFLKIFGWNSTSTDKSQEL